MDLTGTPSIRSRRRRLLTAALLVGALAAGCGDDADPAASGKGWLDRDRSEVEDRDSAPLDGDHAGGVDRREDGDADGSGGGMPVTSAGAGSGSTAGGSTGGGSTGGGQPPAAPAPVIDAFTTPASIDCHNGSFQQFTATWSTTHATKVTISIDGPGIYDTYGPAGEATLPFNCSGPHTFLLTAYATDGTTATEQVTLQPRNAQSGGGAAPEDVEDV